MATRRFSVILEPDADGGFTVLIPDLPNVITQGETMDEALENARDAIALTLDDDADARLPAGRTQLFDIDVVVNRPS